MKVRKKIPVPINLRVTKNSAAKGLIQLAYNTGRSYHVIIISQEQRTVISIIDCFAQGLNNLLCNLFSINKY